MVLFDNLVNEFVDLAQPLTLSMVIRYLSYTYYKTIWPIHILLEIHIRKSYQTFMTDHTTWAKQNIQYWFIYLQSIHNIVSYTAIGFTSWSYVFIHVSWSTILILMSKTMPWIIFAKSFPFFIALDSTHGLVHTSCIAICQFNY